MGRSTIFSNTHQDHNPAHNGRHKSNNHRSDMDWHRSGARKPKALPSDSFPSVGSTKQPAIDVNTLHQLGAVMTNQVDSALILFGLVLIQKAMPSPIPAAPHQAIRPSQDPSPGLSDAAFEEAVERELYRWPQF